MRDENVQMSEAHENDHSLLDEVAFEALSGYSKKIVWKKEQLRNLFGEEFYNQYIRVGILVEDDVLDCDDGRVAEFHAQYIVEIPINCLNLNKSFKECEESNIVLHSGLTLTFLSTLENMQIEMEKDGERQKPKSLSEEEIKAIFKYVIRSRTFKTLSFEGCLLPITLSSDSIPADMQSRDIKVFWNDYGYILNLQSGVWK
ncbi:hypothetical protein BSL78_19289, partial [Apostichopus japonicus]